MIELLRSLHLPPSSCLMEVATIRMVLLEAVTIASLDRELSTTLFSAQCP
jgi:hypothetical protein